MDSTALGTRIKAAREARGLRQIPVAKALGVDQSLVSKWERGVQPDPRTSQLIELARIFGVDFAWLATGEGDAPAFMSAAATGTEG